MSKIYNISLMAFSLFALGGYAQVKDKDKLETISVDIVKPYTPTIADVHKDREETPKKDSVTVAKKKVTYTTHSVPVASTFVPEKGKAVVIILDGKAVAHIRRNHIDKAEIAVVGARTNPVKDGMLELHAKVLVIVLVECNEFLLAVRMFHKEFDLLIRHCKAEIDDVAQRHIVDPENLIPRHKLQFFGNTALQDTQNNARIRFCHSPSFLKESSR